MKGSTVKKIVIVVLIIAMLIPIVMEMQFRPKFEVVSYSELSDILNETKEYDDAYGFALAYISPSSNENADTVRETINDTVATLTHPADKSSTLKTYFIDYDSLTDKEKTEVFGEETSKTAYIFMANGTTVETYVGSLNSSDLTKRASSYSGNTFSSDLAKYKVTDSIDDFKKLIKSKSVTMSVLGSDTCYYCNQFKTIYNKIAGEHDLNSIYYFDLSSYKKDTLDEIEKLNLKIPAECAKSGNETAIEFNDETDEANFGTPLTLFTKNNKVIGCISGYVNEEKLTSKLQEVGILKTEN